MFLSRLLSLIRREPRTAMHRRRPVTRRPASRPSDQNYSGSVSHGTRIYGVIQ
jgi:hypothetical protein